MNLTQQPNRWSCGVASLSMLLQRPVDEVVRIIGHDGSKIIVPDAPEPFNRRSHVIHELQDVCNHFGKYLVPYEGNPLVIDTLPVYDEEYAEARLLGSMAKGPGLIEGMYSLNRPHIVAWDANEVFDPSGPRRYRIDDRMVERISIICFWRLL